MVDELRFLLPIFFIPINQSSFLSLILSSPQHMHTHSGMEEERNGKLLFIGYRVMVLQDEKMPGDGEVDCAIT